MARSFIILLAVFATLLVPADAARAVDGDARVAAQSVLDKRAEAVRDKDKAAFLSTVDPQSPQTFKDEQAKQFDGLQSVPLVDYALRVQTDNSGDLASGLRLSQKYKANSTYLPETLQTYRFADYDDRPAVDAYWYTYVERDGRWYIGADDDAELIGLESAKNLWDSGALTVQRTEHFLVLTHLDQAQRGRTLANIAEEAMERFSARWQRPWSQKIPLLIPGSPEEAAGLLRTTADVANFSAFVSYTPLRGNGWATTAPRIYAQDANLAESSRTTQIGTMVHELTHAATASLTGPFTPVWLHEGLAEYIRRGKPSGASVSSQLPTTEDFTTHDGARLSRAYASATSAVAFLASTKGEAAPEQLFAAVGERRVVAGSPSYNVDQAMRESIGMSIADFEAKWSARAR